MKVTALRIAKFSPKQIWPLYCHVIVTSARPWDISHGRIVTWHRRDYDRPSLFGGKQRTCNVKTHGTCVWIMPKSCCVPGCTASKTRNFVGSTFYILPTEEVRRKKWLVAINRARKNADNSVNKDKLWSPKSIHTYVCSAHFLSGESNSDFIVIYYT